MLLVLIIAISLISTSRAVKLHLSVEENTKPATPIGNIQVLVKNQTNIKLNLDFKSLQFAHQNSESFGGKKFIKIDPKNGDIWLTSSLDREELCSLLSNCEGSTSLDYLIDIDKIVLELKIEIIDINDNSPTFNVDDKQIEIPEGISKFTKYSLPVAKDKDSKRNGIKTYSLKSISNSDDEKYFKLDIKESTKNPYLMVIKELDRESKDSFEFYLFAKDGSDNQGKCKITVKITDINDNTPQWIGLPYTHRVLECTTDHKIKRLMAEDSDDRSTDGGLVRYRISENSANSEFINQKFYITDDTLYSNNAALRSLGQSKLSVYVLASDGGGRTNETTVEIDIIDCNDNAPVITVTKSMPSVIENDRSVTSLTKVTVKDLDHGVNSEFNCHLNDSSHVILMSTYVSEDLPTSRNRIKIYDLRTNPDTGFDRERTPRHVVEIQCTDSGQPPMSSVSVITIHVIDQNDNRPKFDMEFKIFSLSEDSSIGTEVGRVTATDDDASPNNVISYSIVGDETVRNVFSVTNLGSIQLMNTVDREKIDKYEFRIIAADSGMPSMNDSCSIKIIILDVNDCRPEIDKEFHFTIVESNGNEATHKNFGKLTATDRDLGYNGTLLFKLKSTTPNMAAMKVQSDGRLSIYGVIDREKNERIEAEILVIDGGKPPLIATTTVIIEVLDLNDNKPKFQFPNAKFHQVINVTSDMSVGTVIGQLKATDPDKDSNGTIAFSLMGNESQKKWFIINPDGQIMLNEKLKSNHKPENRLFIEAKDGGKPPLSETTTLYVRFLVPISDPGNGKINGHQAGRNERGNEMNSLKNGTNGWSNVMMLIYFLAAAIFIILIGIGGTFLYLWCRGVSHKHAPSRELNSTGYPKNISKTDKHQSVLEINNQFLKPRNDTSYQILDPQCQMLSYPSLIKTYGNPPMEHNYQFRSMMLSGNYSSFDPRSQSPMTDKDHQELSPFASPNNDDIWDNSPSPMVAATIDIRSRNHSEISADNVYDSHKYSTASPGTLDNGCHMNTPSQSRRFGTANPNGDHPYKAKVNYVASSFV